MAKNIGRKFATMSDDERRRFALEEEAGTSEHPAELEFDDPRNEDDRERPVQEERKQGRQNQPDAE